MSTCRCEMCCPSDPAPTYTRRFMLETLARQLLSQFSPPGRRDFIKKVMARPGGNARATELLSEMMKQGGEDVLHD